MGLSLLHSPRQELLVETQGYEEERGGFQKSESLAQGDRVPFPVGEEMIDDIPHGTRYVTHLDMAKAYNQ